MFNGNPIVYVVDDDSAIRRALSRLLRVLGLDTQVFASPQEFLDAARRDTASCLVLDVRLPDVSGLDLQQQLAAKRATLPIIFITGHGDIPMSVRAMKAGAVEFLTKPFREQDLIDAIQRALEQDRVARTRQREITALQRRYESLTGREKDVLPLVVSGLLNKQIAAQLGTSEKTVKVHRGQLMRKMSAGSVADLVRMADRLGVEAGAESLKYGT
jgi:FixJ family two-component response regulator